MGLKMAEEPLINQIYSQSIVPLPKTNISGSQEKANSNNVAEEPLINQIYSQSIVPLPKTNISGSQEKANSNNVVVEKKDSTKLLETEKRLDIPKRNLIQYVYDFQMYYIRSDSVKVDVTNYLNRFTYTMDYDNFVTPIITSLFLVPELILKDIKNDLDNIKFYLTVLKYPRNSFKENTYIKKDFVFKDRELQAIDPIFDINVEDIKEELKTTPRRAVKLDFLLKKDNVINHNVESKVFSNVTILDVLNYLTNKAKEIDAQEAEIKGTSLKVILDPPDNNTKYEQIILDPGTIVDNIYQLQEKYGVYKTGIRVYLNTTNTDVQENSSNIKTERILTVTSKGGVAITDNTIHKVLLEMIGTNNYSDVEVLNGCELDKPNSSLIVRTNSPYQILRNNSNKLLHGDSVRVVGTSQKRNSYSDCDTKDNTYSKQRTYWNNNDNPYTLTALQDTIKEHSSNIVIKVNDIDIFSFNSNMEYNLKFYNSDDNLFSGTYRLTNSRFSFNFSTFKDKQRIMAGGLLRFSNIPKIKINDELQDRSNYKDKLANLNTVSNDFVKSTFNAPDTGTVIKQVTNTIKGPFRVAFSGQEDYNGNIIPDTITSDYKMSKHIIFEDTFITKDAASIPMQQKLDEANALCNNFKYFIAAQAFSNRILDPIIDRWGKFKGSNGKPNDFFRLSRNATATSHHPQAIACDMGLTIPGNSLSEPFFWLFLQRDILGFHQIILEGNGKEWRWIHISCVINGTNEKRITYTKNGLVKKPVYRKINPSKFTSPHLATWNNIDAIAY